MYFIDEFENIQQTDEYEPKVIFRLGVFHRAMAYTNAIPIGVIVGLVSAIIVLVLVLRWLKHKNEQKEAREKDIEAAKVEASAFDDGASDILTPIASPRDALFGANVHGVVSVTDLHAGPNKTEADWSAARRDQGHA